MNYKYHLELNSVMGKTNQETLCYHDTSYKKTYTFRQMIVLVICLSWRKLHLLHIIS